MGDAAYYREKAARFRELAKECDGATAHDLLELANEYDALASKHEPDAEPPIPAA